MAAALFPVGAAGTRPLRQVLAEHPGWTLLCGDDTQTVGDALDQFDRLSPDWDGPEVLVFPLPAGSGQLVMVECDGQGFVRTQLALLVPPEAAESRKPKEERMGR